MRTILLSLFLMGAALAAPNAKPYVLEECSPEKCKLPDCQCSGMTSPAGQKTPQLVLLSFTDAAVQLIYDELWQNILFDRKNPDGCPISGTFFVPHEFSNYEVVNKLYNKGFEIASHSITKNPLADYWRSANLSLITSEMGGQRDILSTFAGIPLSSVTGARIPQLQVNHATFLALQHAGFLYDASWPTQQSRPYFPYTLDFASTQVCTVAAQCYTEPVAGFWELPIVDLVSQDGAACNSLLGCSTNIIPNPLADYWRSANLSLITSEMGGQRDILSTFAGIPLSSVTGARIPQLQVNHATFLALQRAGFLYDASWPTQQSRPYFPYTLDFASTQVCTVAAQCYTEPVAGFWELPIVDLVNQDGAACNSLLGCSTNGTTSELFTWMKSNFQTITSSSRAPFSLIIDYGWYSAAEEHQESLKLFLDYLEEQPDTWLVSHAQALQWAREPTTEFSSCQQRDEAKCQPTTCHWVIGETERYMVVCGKCPENYPWLGNPLGK